MSTFRNLKVYQLCRQLNKEIFTLLKESNCDRTIRDQLSRASMSIALNIAEGAGRFSSKDKKHFYIIARASAAECMAILDIMEDLDILSPLQAARFRERYEELSKMMFGMIRALEAPAQGLAS